MAGLGVGGGALDVLVRFVGDTSKLRDEVGKVEGTGKRIKSWAKGIGGAVATGFAVAKVAEFGKASVDAALESEKATHRLEAVFKSMGDTTGEAAKAAEKYAGQLSKKIGVDDEAIMSAQALLATFADVSSQTARQAGIFDRATAAAADLAAAGYGDLDSNAKQLGKALNDPIKGTAALRKSGIQLTQQQQDQIKAFVKAGDKLGAQKIILGEVEHQVKGTAEATATSSDKMNVAWNETQESVGKALLPVLEKLAPILTKIAGFIQKNITWLMPLAVVIGVLAVAWNIASLAATLFGVSMLAALGPVLLVIAAIAALIAIGVLIVKNWDTIKAAASAVWQFMQKAWDKILGVVKGAFNWIKRNWPLLAAILTGPIGIAVLLITKNWDRILAVVRGVFDWIRRNWPLLVAVLTGPIGIAVALIVKNWDHIRSAVSAAFNFIRQVWSRVLSVLTAPFYAARDIIGGLLGRIRDGIGSAFNFVRDVVGRITGVISGIPDKAREVGGRIVNLLKSPLNTVIRAWNRLSLKVPEFDTHIPGIGKIGGGSIDFPDIPELAKGGLVAATGLAVVHEGETFSGVGNTLGTTYNAPLVWIEHATFAEELDVETFMRRAAWAVQRERI
jgi:hypothetical protein